MILALYKENIQFDKCKSECKKSFGKAFLGVTYSGKKVTVASRSAPLNPPKAYSLPFKTATIR
jgi:hypothetical protein